MVWTKEDYVEFYSRLFDGRLFLQPGTAAPLHAPASPPPVPRTVEAGVTMASDESNDEGRAASHTSRFATTEGGEE